MEESHRSHSQSSSQIQMAFPPSGVMASRLLYRLKRSLFKDGQGAGPEQESACGQEVEDGWEAELEEEEEERVTDRLGGTLSFDAGGGEGVEDGSEELDSDSDYLGESMEEGLSSTGGIYAWVQIRFFFLFGCRLDVVTLASLLVLLFEGRLVEASVSNAPGSSSYDATS